MTKLAWMTTVAIGVAIGAPSVAHAHGQYLDLITDTTDAEIAAPACDLPGSTCGLCHQPLEGDRLENVTVGFKEIDTEDRNGPFYDSLMANGWDHMPHMMDDNAHRDMNVDLLDTVLPMMIANEVDSDGDGVADLEELALGYNPLLAYEERDPARSQLCGSAGEFPDVGGTTSEGGSSTGDGMTSGSESGSTGDPGGTGEPGDSSGVTGDPPPATDDGSGSSGGSGGSGSGGEDTGSGDGDEGGCRIGGSGYGGSTLSLLLLMGLAARRRRHG